MNTHERLNEVMRNPRMLRRTTDLSNKPRKHRYERRKVRSLLRLGDWSEDDSI